MCYFTNDFFNEMQLREELQKKVINNELNLDFYCRLKQLNLLKLSQNYSEKTVDTEGSIRNILASIIILLNSDVFIKTNIPTSKYNYLLNSFLFEMTFCENLFKAIKNSKSKNVFVKAKFFNYGFKIIIYYKGQKYHTSTYQPNSVVKPINFKLFNRVELCFNAVKKTKEKPSKINLDSFLLNKLSSVYIALNLSGLKALN